MNAHSTLWHSYTDGHRAQLIVDAISNSDHITISTNTPTRVANTTLQQTSSPDITTVSNTLYNRTSWTTQHTLSSDHRPIITTINIRHDYILPQNRWTQRSDDHTQQHTHCQHTFYKHHTDDRQTQLTKGQDAMHSNCRFLPDHIVCKITQRNNIRRANTCNPALKLLNEEITSDIQKHKQYIWKEHLDAHWDHRHNTNILCKTIPSIQQSTSTYTKHIHNIQQQNSNHTQTYCELFHQAIHKHCQTATHKTKRYINRATH